MRHLLAAQRSGRGSNSRPDVCFGACVFLLLTRCCDSGLRRSWQRDRNARARGRFQRAVSGHLSHNSDFYFAFFAVGHQYRGAIYDAPQEIAAPTSSRISARCFQNDESLFALLNVARIVFESQMANDATAYNIEDFHARLRGSATSRQTRCRSNQRCACLQSDVVSRAKRSQRRS
jgi:hypothetical protein